MNAGADSSDDVQVQAMLERALAHLGASREQATIMAAQLIKRARQVAGERGIAESSAMAELLQKVIAGRKGEYMGQPPANPPPQESR